MNGIVLEKGQRINLSKQVANLQQVSVTIGWKANTADTGTDFDVDVSAFICKANEKNDPVLIGNKWFIFYNEYSSPDGSVVHQGDDTTGGSGGDCEEIVVNLTEHDLRIQEISFIVTIHDAVNRKQNFGQIRDAYVKITNKIDGVVIATYDLSNDFSTETAIQVGSLYKKDADWLFQAVGTGYKLGLEAFVRQYGGELV
jgi:tellurium resistance protein TerD